MLDQHQYAATAAAPAVALRGVRKIYGEGELAVRALDGVELEIGAGELVVVLGPSGSGKTTLLNVIGVIEPASGGSVIVAGSDLGPLDEEGRTTFRRQSLGFVFQFFNLIPTLTALENVELIAELAARGGAAHARALLADVGLGDRVDHFPAQLSGGEQQRVAVARALAGDRRCRCVMSGPARWTRRRAASCWACCARSTGHRGGPCCWSPTTAPSRGWPTACCGSARDGSSTMRTTLLRWLPRSLSGEDAAVQATPRPRPTGGHSSPRSRRRCCSASVGSARRSTPSGGCEPEPPAAKST